MGASITTMGDIGRFEYPVRILETYHVFFVRPKKQSMGPFSEDPGSSQERIMYGLPPRKKDTESDVSSQRLTECIVLWLEDQGFKHEDIVVEALVGCFTITGAKYVIDVWYDDWMPRSWAHKVTSLKVSEDRIWTQDDIVNFDYCSPNFFDELAKYLGLVEKVTQN